MTLKGRFRIGPLRSGFNRLFSSGSGSPRKRKNLLWRKREFPTLSWDFSLDLVPI